MESVSVKFIAKQLWKYLWLAVLVGIIFAAGFFFISKADADSVSAETEPEEAIIEAESEEPKTYSDYNGDYLSQPETKRFAVYHLKWESDPVLSLTDTTWKLGDFSWEVIDYIKQRLTSGAFSHEWYQAMCRQFPEIKKNQKAFNVLIVEQEMLSVGVDHRANLWIDVRAPLSLNSTEEVYTEKQLCAYRDCLYRLVAATVDSGVLTDDLAVSLERVNPVVEDSLSKQVYVVNNLNEKELAEVPIAPQADTAETNVDKKPLAIKKIILAFSLGVLLVEILVLIIALQDDKVHTCEEILQGSKATVLGVVQKREPDCREAALKLAIKANKSSKYVLVPTGETCKDYEKIALQLSSDLNRVFHECSEESEETQRNRPKVELLPSDDLWAPELMKFQGAQAILLVELGETKHSDIRAKEQYLDQIGISKKSLLVVAP